MSNWFVGNNIVGNFKPEKYISNPKIYKIEKYDSQLYLCKDKEKILLKPIDLETENVVSLFSNENEKDNESIYRIETNNNIIVIILYIYREIKKINGINSINIHLSNSDEMQIISGNMKNIPIMPKVDITKYLRENFCKNNSIFVLPESDKKNFEIWGNGIKAHVRMERTGVYLLDKIRKIGNKSKFDRLVQLFGKINFVLWEESTSIECSSNLTFNDSTPNEIFKSWDSYQKFKKNEYIKKLSTYGLIRYENVEIEFEKMLITFKLKNKLNNDYFNENNKFDVIPNQKKEIKTDEIFSIKHSKYLGKYKYYNEEEMLLSFSLNNNLYNIDLNEPGYLYLSKFSLDIESKRREKVTKAINNKTNSTLNLLMRLSDKDIKNSDLGTDFEPIKSEVIYNMFNNKNVRINENYREAMYIAINTPDIALIQGPPGSGKTTLIKGIVSRLQLQNKNYHLLISSEQHEALYNVIEKLSCTNNIPPFVSSVKNDMFDDDNDNHKYDVNERFESNVKKFQNSFLSHCDNILAKLENKSINKSDIYIELSFMIQNIKEKKYDKKYILELLPEMKNKLISLGIIHDIIDELAQIESKLQSSSISPFYSILEKKINRQIMIKEDFISEFGYLELESLQERLKEMDLDNLLIEDDILNKLKSQSITEEEFEKYIKYINSLKEYINLTIKDNTEIVSLINDLAIKILKHSNKLPKTIYEIIESLKFKLMDIDNSYDLIKKYTSVIGSTCAQANKSFEYINLDKERYDYVIVDEASHANPLELMIPIMYGAKIILIGDHKQLPHYIEAETMNEFNKIQNENKEHDSNILRKSLFQILFENLEKAYKEERLNFKRTIMLEEQHRMHPKIANYISKAFYNNELKNAPETYNNINDYNIFNGKNIVWKNVSKYEGGIEEGKYYRRSEVNAICDILQQLSFKNQNRKLNVGIISYYKEQTKIIKDKLIKEFPSNIFAHTFEEMVGTIDSFQGKEFDIVILSGVRSNNESDGRRRLGFIHNEYSRINVSLTRAKKLLIIVADEETFGKNELFQNLINYIKMEGYYE